MSMSMSKHVSPRVPGSTSVSMKTYLDIVKECDKSVSFPRPLPLPFSALPTSDQVLGCRHAKP